MGKGDKQKKDRVSRKDVEAERDRALAQLGELVAQRQGETVTAVPVPVGESDAPELPMLPPPAAVVPPSVVGDVLDRVTGAQLCFGEPVTGGETTVVPVARVRVAGGGGYGRADGEGGGGGGAVDGKAVGFIEIRPDGASYRPIDRSRMNSAALMGAAAAGSLVAAAAVGFLGGLGRRRTRRRF